MNENKTQQSENCYTGPVWAKYGGRYEEGRVFHVNGKTLFYINEYCGLRELDSQITDKSDHAYSGVTEWFPRETWWMRLQSARGTDMRARLTESLIMTAIIVVGILVMFSGIHLIWR